MEEGLCVFDNPNRRAVAVVVVPWIANQPADTILAVVGASGVQPRNPR